MDLHFENPQVIMAVLALLSISAACLFTLCYLRDDRRGSRAVGGMSRGGPTFIRLSDYRKEVRRRDRPAA